MTKPALKIVAFASNAILTQEIADSTLIQACDEYTESLGEYFELFVGPNAIEDDHERDIAIAPLADRQSQLLTVIANNGLRATSLAGMQARAKAALLFAAGDHTPMFHAAGEDVEGPAADISACLLSDIINFNISGSIIQAI